MKYICPHCGVEMAPVFCECADIKEQDVYKAEDGHKYHKTCNLRLGPAIVDKYQAAETKDRSRSEYEKFEKDLVEYWNRFVAGHPGLGAVIKISDTRRRHLKARYESAHYKAEIKRAIDRIAGSPFLLGKAKPTWRVSFDFMIENDANYIKVMEGKYEDKAAAPIGIHRFIKP